MTHSPFRVIDGKTATSAPIIAMAMDEVLWQLVQLLIEEDIIAKEDLATRLDRVTSRLSNGSATSPDSAALAATLQQVVRALA